jgi:hypothetical protein
MGRKLNNEVKFEISTRFGYIVQWWKYRVDAWGGGW